ncbi:hypothetical protein FQA39_LY17736 [Lamprigera yunnana]|nr:hypothetical protein FQA39_LY17736 [Lamprigera yunnana]
MARNERYLFLFNLFLLAQGASLNKPKDYEDEFEVIDPVPESLIIKQDANHWIQEGTTHLTHILDILQQEQKQTAKNVIIFIGDGMGATSATAGRIYKGQRNGLMGEENFLSFDRFPNIALAKTYNVDKQVPDSAGTATSIFTGVKSRFKMIGLDARSTFGKFDEAVFEKSKIASIMTWGQEANKDTGIVTTTRVTHATPAGTYAHVPNRDWECDSLVPEMYRHRLKDVARQLIEDPPGNKFKVILGGGQENMGYVELNSSRRDGLNLTKLWSQKHQKDRAHFVANKADLENLPEDTEYLLGLFAATHLPYELIRQKHFPNVPSLSDMTTAALKVLKKSAEGYVLMVEGGLIDKAHHDNYARLALEEVSEFDNAVEVALNQADSDTLIIVTSDHSHSFIFNGYPRRGNDILGLGNDTFPYLTLSYGNGPGFDYHYVNETTSDGYPWRNLPDDRTRGKNPYYQHLASFYLYEDTHGGEDVPIYAKGPASHLFKGVMEQSNIAHIISYAMCIGPHRHMNAYCQSKENPMNHSSSLNLHFNLLTITILIFVVMP